MKTKSFFLLLLATLPFLPLFFSCGEKTTNTDNIPGERTTCTRRIYFDLQLWPQQTNQPNQAVTTYRCREVILTYSKDSDPIWLDTIKAYLSDNGFVPTDTCPCAQGLELWRLSDTINGNPDLQGVVTGGNDKADNVGGGDGLTLNFDLDLDTSSTAPGAAGEPAEEQLVYPDIDTIVVAIIDSGVDTAHPLLSGFFWKRPPPGDGCVDRVDNYGLNMAAPAQAPLDKLGHGTMVNGIVAGVVKWSEDGDSIAPHPNLGVPLQLLNVKYTQGKTGSGTLYHAICGSHYAIGEGAKVLNMSWRYIDKDPPRAMIPLLRKARNHNVVVVAAMGNDAADLDAGVKAWPAAFAANPAFDVVSVGATVSGELDLARFSNRADEPLMSLAAPGSPVVSTHLDGDFARSAGTSYSAPKVTRTAAILIGLNPAASSRDIKNRLLNTATEAAGKGAPFQVLNFKKATGGG